MDIQQTARRLGYYAWTERRAFELLGAWVAVAPEADVKLRFGTDSYKHAWHAQLWTERLPQLPGLDAQSLIVAPNSAVEHFMEALAGPTAPEQTIERLVGVYRVLLPHAVAAYRSHLEQTSAITDGPVIRALHLVLRDELDDWRDGELLLQSLLHGDDDVQRAARHQAALETLLVAGGGIAGAPANGLVTEGAPALPPG